MRQENVASLATVAVMSLFLTFLASPMAHAQEESLLWNAGPSYRAGIHSNNSLNGVCEITAISDMSQDLNVGNPAACQAIPCGSSPQINPSNTCPSYYHVTYGWNNQPKTYTDSVNGTVTIPSQYAVYPGWAIWYMSGGAGTPITLRLLNNAYSITPIINPATNSPYPETDPCQLRETSTSYVHFPAVQNGDWGFKRKYDISNFAKISGTFSARLNYASSSVKCAATPSAYITSDFSVQYRNSANVPLRTDTIGVLVYNLNNYDMNGNSSDNIFYSNGCSQASPSCDVLLQGSKLGYQRMTGTFSNYSIEYLSLINQYLPPPPVGTASSVLTVWEVYSSTRGADIEFDLNSMDVVGIPK